MMTPGDFLKKLGLTDNQTKVYLDLAAYPESTVVQIHKRIEEPRSTIYLELERPADRGFVISKKVGKSTYFKVTDPKVLQLNLEEEAKRLQFLNENLEGFDKKVKELEVTKETERTINIYKGQEGVKQLLWNILVSKPKLVVGFSPGQLEDITDRKFSEKWRAEFKRRGLHNKIIFNKPKPLKWSDVPGFLEENVEARTLDEKKIKFDRMTLIYKDVLTVCSSIEDEDQYGIEIKDELLINSYMQLFNFLWEHVAKPL